MNTQIETEAQTKRAIAIDKMMWDARKTGEIEGLTQVRRLTELVTDIDLLRSVLEGAIYDKTDRLRRRAGAA